MRIGIVGSGTAGASSAILLRRAGHEVAIFERVPKPAAVGAGILLQPTGQRVLARLRLLDRITSAGAPVRRLHGVHPDGRDVMDLGYGELGFDLCAYGLHRGTLFVTMLDAAREAGAQLVPGTDVTGIDCDAGVLRTSDGRTLGPFDLVVVADGARSGLRNQVCTPTRDRPYPWGALWFVGRSWERAESGALYQVFDGTQRLLGLLPTGKTPDGADVVSLFWGVRNDTVDGLRARGVDAWKADVRRLTRKADPLLDQITDVDQLVAATYRDTVVRTPWRGRAVLLGDAAHAMSPQLGQGVNLALCDALALEDALAVTWDLEQALAGYAHARRNHIRFYTLASRWLTPLFQSDLPGFGLARDFGVPLFNAIAWPRRQALLSMAGLKDGPLSSWPVRAITS
jgi:2-polyprenyl-6-methoxyphenol hydroxylase-like FAD-dependent oxidoreductase